MTGHSFRLGCGIGIGLFWLWFAAPQFLITRSSLVKSVWALSLFALAAGRIGYGLMHIEYFYQNPVHLLQLHRVGGVHGESALIGGLIAIGILAARRHRGNTIKDVLIIDSKQSFAKSFDHLLMLFTPAVLSVAAGVWWACMHTGCAWGRVVSLSDSRFQWLLSDGPDLYHNIQQRYPVQHLGIITALISATLSIKRPHNRRNGFSALVLYCLGVTFLTFLRGDPIPKLGPFRVDTIQNIGIAFILGGIQWWHNTRLKL